MIKDHARKRQPHSKRTRKENHQDNTCLGETLFGASNNELELSFSKITTDPFASTITKCKTSSTTNSQNKPAPYTLKN